MTLKVLYNSLILPHLQYGLLLWGKHGNELSILQKRALRVISKSNYSSHSEPLFKNMLLLKLEDMYTLSALKFHFKHMNDLLPQYFYEMFKDEALTHQHHTRNRLATYLQKPNHKLLEKSIRYQIPLIILDLPDIVTDKVTTHSLHGFSTYAKKYLINKYSELCTSENCYTCLKTG